MSDGNQTREYDLAVIGAGSAGFAAARTAADAGWRVAILDGADEVGGLCILRGCMPTKALLYAAEVLHLCRTAGTWGIRTDDVGFNFSRVMARKDALIKEFADYRRQQLADRKFEFIRAQARFLDPHTLALSNGRKVAAKHFVIATGSVVAPPPLEGLNEAGFITSDDALALSRLPRSLIVLGGGPVAVELAQFFARFGVKVTLVQRSAHLLKEFDTDAAEVLEQVLRREGIDLFTGTQLAGARRQGDLKEVSFRHQGKIVSVAAEEILFALGRTPNTASLNLEAAGVKTNGPGIVTNDKMQTSASAHLCRRAIAAARMRSCTWPSSRPRSRSTTSCTRLLPGALTTACSSAWSSPIRSWPGSASRRRKPRRAAWSACPPNTPSTTMANL